MRIAVLAFLAGCSIKADFTGTLFHCGDNDSCPASYVCLQTYCVPDMPNDAGVDAAGASCGGGDISLGLEHSCTLRADGTTWCWGRNDYGQVGDGTLVDQTKPVQVSNLPAAKQLSAGSLHTCALAADDGTVWCWGHNNVGELGDGSLSDSRVPLKVPGITGALGVATADQHTCALLADRTVSCWGYNGYGQLGDNTMMDHHSPLGVQMLSSIASISAGGNTTCAVDTSGSVWCWGEDDYGSVGNNDPNGTNVLLPYKLPLTDIASVSVGFYFACAVGATSGQVSCWGGSGEGEMGDGDYNGSFVPVTAGVPAKVVAVSSGQMHVCARDDQHRLWCWGYDEDNEFGDGLRSVRTTPLLAFSNVDAFGTGGFDTCVQQAGALSCAGDNARGELGFGQEAAALVPTVSPALAGLTHLSAGIGFACGIAGDATVACWGQNNSGQLGDATFVGHSLPKPSFGLTGVTALSAGQQHACALLTDGSVSCWGNGNQGQLGDNTTSNTRPVAQPVVMLGGAASQISAGYFHTCAIVGSGPNGGTVKCWGRSLGNGNPTLNLAVPTVVPGAPLATQVASGDQHSCALKSDGTVWCWGSNAYGQLGINNIMPAAGVVQVGGLNGVVVEIGSFADYTCARKNDGTVACWGEDFNGRLGNGQSVQDVPTPTPVLNILTATKLFTGPDHACVLRNDNTLACWGAGSSGQIGDNTVADHLAPEQANATNITSATLGNLFSCANRNDGAVLCWGDDHQGQLGDGVDISTTSVRSVALTCP